MLQRSDIKNESVESSDMEKTPEIPEAVKEWLEHMSSESPEKAAGEIEVKEDAGQDEGDEAENPEKKEADTAELLEKIRDCDEDDFNFEDFDFEDEKLEKILKYFQPEVWGKLDFREKDRVIREFAGYLITKLEIQKEPTLNYYRGLLNVGGFYNPDTCQIKINYNLMNDGKETLNTVAHEMRHAYQHDRAEKMETEKDKMYRLNFDNYVKVEVVDGKYVNFDAYESQLVEAEARAFANKFEEKVGGK